MEEIVDHGIIEDRALKKMLGPSDYVREVAIPRAEIKRFPSNVSTFKRSIPKAGPGESFKTKPIDIATLGEAGNWESPASAEIGRSYSNGGQDTVDNLKRSTSTTSAAAVAVAAPPPPSNTNGLKSREIENTWGAGGGSFLYSGNYDPRRPNSTTVTKPVPLTRSLLSLSNTTHRKTYMEKHQGKKGKTSFSKNAPTPKNPLALASQNETDSEEEDLNKNEFDGWASELYEESAAAVAPTKGKAASRSRSSSSPAQKEPLKRQRTEHSYTGMMGEDEETQDDVFTEIVEKLGKRGGRRVSSAMGRKISQEIHSVVQSEDVGVGVDGNKAATAPEQNNLYPTGNQTNKSTSKCVIT